MRYTPHWLPVSIITYPTHARGIIVNYTPSGGEASFNFVFSLICTVKLYQETFVYYSVHSRYFSPQALRLSQASLKETTTGQIVNLVTSDIQRLEQVNSSTAKISPACLNDFVRDLNLILSLC